MYREKNLPKERVIINIKGIKSKQIHKGCSIIFDRLSNDTPLSNKTDIKIIQTHKCQGDFNILYVTSNTGKH